MSSRILKVLAILAVATLVTGCKLAVMVVEGGNVESPLGTTFCSEGNNCLIEITDTGYSESFTAIAKPGYVFTKWNTGGGFICADSTSPTCTVSVPVGALGDVIVANFEWRGYIMPVFGFVGIDTDGDGEKDHIDKDDDNDGVLDVDDACPLDQYNQCIPLRDMITVNGKIWAQPELFTGLSWNDINDVCPTEALGAGLCNGQLNGYDLTGWKWASYEDAYELFNSYGVLPILNSPTNRLVLNSTWAPAFFADGWRALSLQQGPALYGLLRSTFQDSTNTTRAAEVEMKDESDDVCCDVVNTDRWRALNESATILGGMFYKTQQ